MQNHPGGWGNPSGQQAGWGQQGQVQQAYGASWGAPPAATAPLPQYGDAAGEYLHMTRGRYSATVYVFFAFVMQMGLVCLLVGGIPALVLGSMSKNSVLALGVFLVLGIPAGGAAAYFMFRDRWKCIEAFSSRFCSGLMNLSLMYVPIIALVYANIRGFQKFAGK